MDCIANCNTSLPLPMQARILEAAVEEFRPLDEMLALLIVEGIRARYGVELNVDGSVKQEAGHD